MLNRICQRLRALTTEGQPSRGNLPNYSTKVYWSGDIIDDVHFTLAISACINHYCLDRCLVPVYCILSICLEPPILDFGWSTPCSASTCLQQQKRTKWIIRQPQSRTFCLFWFRILCSTSARADDVAACEWEGLIGGCTPKKILRVHGVPPHPKLKITHKRTMIP